ncbi:MAG: TorF family putative porin [Gammaproteobacteria bacterium]
MAKHTLTKSGVALLCAVAGGAQAAEVTANIGYMSEYIFRGISQSDSSAMGGIDLKANGFYLGNWNADVGQGLEVDLYGGYNGSIGDVNFGIGGTYYTYTDSFDDDYQELNLSLGYKIFSISAAIGEYDNFDGPDGDGGQGSLDYTYIAPRVDYKGFYGLVGMFSQDFDTTYYELGYGSQFEPIGLDYKVSLIYTDDTAIKDFEESDSGETSFVFSISKSFGLLK